MIRVTPEARQALTWPESRDPSEYMARLGELYPVTMTLEQTIMAEQVRIGIRRWYAAMPTAILTHLASLGVGEELLPMYGKA